MEVAARGRRGRSDGSGAQGELAMAAVGVAEPAQVLGAGDKGQWNLRGRTSSRRRGAAGAAGAAVVSSRRFGAAGAW